MSIKRPNANIEIVSSVSDRHLIPLVNIDGTTNHKRLFLEAQNAGNGPSGIIKTGFPLGPGQSVSGSGNLGAIDLDGYLSVLYTLGGVNMTMAAGYAIGHLKKLLLTSTADWFDIAVAGDGITEISYNEIGEYIVVCWNGTGWVKVNSGSQVTGVYGGPLTLP